VSTYPLTIVEQARVLRPAVPDRPGQRRHQAVVVWNLDGTPTHRDILLPFLRQVCEPLRVSREAAAAAPKGPGEWWPIWPSGRPARSGRTEICPLTVICPTLPTSPSGYARCGTSTR
jgi:hypothetical protein